MLAAYAPYHPLFTPEDVRGSDLSVRGVIGYYNGVTGAWDSNVFLGGRPDEWPELYRQISPIVHVRPDVPPCLRPFLPTVSPAAQASMYDTDRFLGLMASPVDWKAARSVVRAK